MAFGTVKPFSAARCSNRDLCVEDVFAISDITQSKSELQGSRVSTHHMDYGQGQKLVAESKSVA
jgi:hypothetical protein